MKNEKTKVINQEEIVQTDNGMLDEQVQDNQAVDDSIEETDTILDEAASNKEEEDLRQSIYDRLVKEISLKQKQEQDLLHIRRIDPSVVDLNELGEEFAGLMKTGLVDAVTAYYATVGRGTTFAPQSSGKEHLVKSGGAVGVPTGKDIPRDQLAEWHEMFPEADMKALREIYNRALDSGL